MCSAADFEPTRQTADEELDGVFEGVIDGRAVGWAYDRAAPERKVVLELSVDGESVGRTVADLPRPSLKAEGVGDGYHGFVVNLPATTRDNREHVVAISQPRGRSLRVGQAFRSNPVAPPQQRRKASELRLRPSDEAYFLRRDLSEGFSDGSEPETIFLAERELEVRPAAPVRFAIQPSVRAPQSEREHRARNGAYMARRPSVCRMPSGIVDGECFLTCPDERHYLTDSLRGRRITEWFGYDVLPDGTQARQVDAIEERDEQVVVLGAQNNSNYSHWLIESVARAALFRSLDDGSRRFLTPPLSPWQREALEFAGVSLERLLEIEPSGLTRFAEVIAVTRGMAKIQELNPAVLSALAELAPASRGRRRRLFVSRAHTKVRRVTNEAELVEFFQTHGFEVVHPQLLSMSEQAELFAGAEMVAGPHGSGNSGVIFSAPGTLVIELQTEGFDRGGVEYLWNLCAVRGHRFVQIVCGHTPGTDHVPSTHRDMTVDLRHLATTLTGLL